MAQSLRNPRRRRFLTSAVSAAAAGSLISCQRAGSQWRFFTDEEAKTVEAISERFIPADQDPGAAWAGVVRYIDLQLAVRFNYRVFRALYRRGLAGVDQTSAALFQGRFVELTTEQQVTVLHALAAGKPPGAIWTEIPVQQFFETILSHTMQGYYGDPRHGGNRDRIGCRMLGIPALPTRGRQAYDLQTPPPAGKGIS